MATSKRIKAPAYPKVVTASSKVDWSNDAVAAPAAVAPPLEAIATRAYQLWRESGCAHGNDQAHWFQAERELRARPARAR